MDNQNNNENEYTENLDSLDILYGKPTLTKKEKFKNFIYYYKTTIIICICVAAVLGVLIHQAASKTEPDITLLYTGRYYIDPSSYENIEAFFDELVGVDYNKDGEFKIRLVSRTIKTADKQQQEQDESDKLLYDSVSADDLSLFRTELLAGETIICFIDENLYKTIEDKERFMTLEKALGEKPEKAVDDYGIYLKDTPFGDATKEFKTLGDDTIVCIKKRIVSIDTEIYNNNLEAFKKMFDYE